MRFLVEPGTVTLGVGQWLCLAVLVVALPFAAFRQHRVLAMAPLRLTRREVYASALVTHAVLLILVWLAARSQPWNGQLLASHGVSARDLLVGGGALAIGVTPFLSTRVERWLRAERARLIAPRTSSEFALFYTLCLSAGFAEELAYRGVLFALLSSLTSSWWLSAVVAAAAFGLAHLFQGWRSAGVAALAGLRDHIVVGLTGTLWVVIFVHIVHDMIAGTTIGLRARRQEERALALP